MLNDGINACPNCGCKDYAVIGVDSSDGYVSLCIYSAGGVKLNVCPDCGTVYVEKKYLEQIKEGK